MDQCEVEGFSILDDRIITGACIGHMMTRHAAEEGYVPVRDDSLHYGREARATVSARV